LLYGESGRRQIETLGMVKKAGSRRRSSDLGRGRRRGQTVRDHGRRTGAGQTTRDEEK
jgi:hypothetical protein